MPAEPTVAADKPEEQDDAVSDGPEIFYVCKKSLQECRDTLKAGGEITEEMVKKLVDSDGLPDDEVMVPIDMRGAGDDLADDVEEMLEKLGPKGTAEALIKCADFFEGNKDKFAEEERPKEMTAADWRQALEEEDDLLEGEEEDAEEAEEEEDDGEDAEEGDAEPPAKKAKTDA